MKLERNLDEKMIGKKMLLNCISMEKSLADILRTEAKILKKQTLDKDNDQEIKNINKMIKNILFLLMLIDERVQISLNLINDDPIKK